MNREEIIKIIARSLPMHFTNEAAELVFENLSKRGLVSNGSYGVENWKGELMWLRIAFDFSTTESIKTFGFDKAKQYHSIDPHLNNLFNDYMEREEIRRRSELLHSHFPYTADHQIEFPEPGFEA